jgi:predicted Zn-dependent protease
MNLVLTQPVMIVLALIGTHQLTKKQIQSTLVLIFLLSQFVFQTKVQAQDSPVMTVMETELNRSFSKFKLIKEAPVYFMGYRLYDTQTDSISAQYGALSLESIPKRSRTLNIDLRIGSPQLDNTHKTRDDIRPNLAALISQAMSFIPLEDDELALREAIWLKTDGTFKNAQKHYALVKANQELQTEEEDTSGDFSIEKQCIYTDKNLQLKTLPIDHKIWEEKVKQLSAIYKNYPNILNSHVDFQAVKTLRYFVNSEGTKVQDQNIHYRLSTRAETLAPDGMKLWLYDGSEVNTLDALPTKDQFALTVKNLADSLEQLRKAPLAEPYTGPAILNTKAAGVYFHETLGHRVEGNRQKDMDDGRTFAKKLGQQILPTFISVIDDPTCAQIKNKSLNGSYTIDDEGVLAQKVTIVDHGILKTFLTGRSPVKGCTHSNGHGRCAPSYPPIARQGNLMIVADKGIPYNDLRLALIAEAKKQGKPYGLIFDQIAGGFTYTQTATPQTFKLMPLLVKRVYVDGKPDELIRGADLVGTPLTSLENIIQAADDTDTFNGTCGAQSGWVPVSANSPSLLIKTIEVERKANFQQKPPILPAPNTENTGTTNEAK